MYKSIWFSWKWFSQLWEPLVFKGDFSQLNINFIFLNKRVCNYSQLKDNRDARFPAEVRHPVITGGMQGENRPENWDESHPIPENRPTRITSLKKISLGPNTRTSTRVWKLLKRAPKPSWNLIGWYEKISKFQNIWKPDQHWVIHSRLEWMNRYKF
jgi:hypothetical protein